MTGGYFNDGDTYLELGQHVWISPSTARFIVQTRPLGDPAINMDSGGGAYDLIVGCQRLRANLGDAERWIYETLRSLAYTGPGELACEDYRDDRVIFSNVACVAGRGETHAFKFADVSLTFRGGESPTTPAPAWDGVPATAGTYAGTDTLQDYAAGGRTLGRGVSMALELTREYPYRVIPRARGARAAPPVRGAAIRFIVLFAMYEPAQNVMRALRTLEVDLSARPVDLTGNGNTFANVILESVEARHSDDQHTLCEATFVQTLPRVAPTTHAPYPTTSPLPPATTTTAEAPGTTSSAPPPTTSSAAPPTTSTGAPPPGSTTSAYCPGDCSGMPSPLSSNSLSGIYCGHVAEFSGSGSWSYAGSCEWTYSGGFSTGNASSITCTDGVWQVTLTHGPTGQTGIYEKSAGGGDDPTGTYTKAGGTCGDMPASIVIS